MKAGMGIALFLILTGMCFMGAASVMDAVARWEEARTEIVRIREQEHTNRVLISEAGRTARNNQPLPTLAATTK